MKNVNQDVFASFADAQMSREEMKMVKGGGSCTCKVTLSQRRKTSDDSYTVYCQPPVGDTVIYKSMWGVLVGSTITYNC